MRRRCVVPVVVAAFALCAAPAAVAHPPAKAGGPVVAPIERIGGLTGPELLAESGSARS